MKESEDHSVVSNSLRPPGLYSPWNSPGQNTRVYSVEACPFSSRSFTPRDRTRVSCIARGFFTNWPISKITTVLLYCRIISIYCLVVFHFSVEIWFYLFYVNHSDYFQHKITKEKETDSLSAEDSESLGETADILNMVRVFLFVQYRYKFEF